MAIVLTSQDAKFLGPSIEEILSCIADAVISTDINGKILLFNPAAETIFGYSAPDILGSNIEMLIPGRFRESHAAQVASFGSAPKDLARAMASERDVLGLRSDGTEFAAEAMLSCRHLERMTLLTVIIRDVSERKALEEERHVIALEMAHRFSNVMAMVNSVIRLTARSVLTVDEFSEALEGRVGAILRNQASLVEPGREALFSELVDYELAPFRSCVSNRVRATGPKVTVCARLAVRISLVLHEMTTNAVKYGALSTDDGLLQLEWETEQVGDASYVLLDWIETGGPPVTPPVRRGSGSSLIERSFGVSSSTIEYRSEGLAAHFRIRL